MAKRDAQIERPTERPTTEPDVPDLLAAELAELGKKQIETITKAQTQVFDAIEAWNHDLLSHAKSQAILASDIAARLMAARSIPETATACQDWLSRRDDVFGKDSQRFFAAS